MATGVGREACRKGYELRFYRVADLVDQLEKAWREGRFQTAALVDRVIHHAHILSFTGDSYRVTHTLSKS
ncbi:hypothetical protein D7Z54_33550 [Salibacterium salarium]|uniref:IstB-like ATP-binding domain-containing protein n=1 Tax=Salibacterium salarium TaxID=284579 RepID=A0A428MSC5_9BACI|nr:hypothetical protein D7Z54_33550 [Salibacterium salarium]